MLFISENIRKLRRMAEKIAASDISVMINGETGTGKEVFARLIHEASPRADKPFVPVNCGVYEGELFADRFFGHEQGAFTGAVKQRKGCFEMSMSGTLFMDEVGEIPLANQSDFLRVLEERKFKRLGGHDDIPFQARLVTATNRDIPAMIRAGKYRSDLYHRLNMITLSIPPLRERRDEIIPIANYYLAEYGKKYHKSRLFMGAKTKDKLMSYPWPGNIRELKNLIERLALLTDDGEVTEEHLPPEMIDGEFFDPETNEPVILDMESARRDAEIKVILRAIRVAGGNRQEACKLLGISPRTLRYKLSEYEIQILSVDEAVDLIVGKG